MDELDPKEIEEIKQDHLQGDVDDALKAELEYELKVRNGEEAVEDTFTSEEDGEIRDPDSVKY